MMRKERIITKWEFERQELLDLLIGAKTSPSTAKHYRLSLYEVGSQMFLEISTTKRVPTPNPPGNTYKVPIL